MTRPPLPPNDLRAELPRAIPLRATINGVVVELEAEPVAWFLERWKSDKPNAAIEAIEAAELAAAEALAARHKVHIEWITDPALDRSCATLFEGDRYVGAEDWDVVPSADGRRMLSAVMLLTFFRRPR